LAEVCGYALTHAPAAVVPESGGFRPHLDVLVRLEDLEDRCRSAVLDFGGAVTPGELRALACDAAVVPIVLDGRGQVLDIGRLTRTVPDGLRRAVAARDLGCAHPGCDRPGSWCEIHHVQPWAQGGETKLDNLVLLCKVHHRILHADSGWTVRVPDGLPGVRPAEVDRPDPEPTTKADTPPARPTLRTRVPRRGAPPAAPRRPRAARPVRSGPWPHGPGTDSRPDERSTLLPRRTAAPAWPEG
jgi:5-methylcytosine-specific restriction protein A